MIVIDGSIGEGGGQILRTTLALAALLGKPVRIVNIRAKRPRPGLQRQHLTSVKAVAELASARVEGLELGSTTLVFIPRGLRSGRFYFNIGTAGSITLVLQALLPVTAFAPGPVEVEIVGGTDVPWSPPIDYVRFVLRKLLAMFGFEFEIIVKRRGHYPRGGGRVVLRVTQPPHVLKPVKLEERGKVLRVEGLSHAVRLPRHVAERQARSAEAVLRSKLPGVPISIDLEWYEPSRDPHLGPGSGVVVWAVAEHSVLGSDSLGAKGKPAEAVGREAAEKLLEDLATGTALDRHASDMLIPYAALACGESILGGARLTMHAWTNIEVVKMLVPGAEMEFIEGGKLNEKFKLRVKGICYKPSS
ncbi:RNA 3'-terminal phosphate cyclase [Hyperthermus butylicus]|uniref:RNA 3'-terminal phosphate cyclase n=1 Tax=Hyperthermus butylicus (strain DSM 5456 / JCM 9403 / PLM1-5) TaxID=415426 RepID=RTCA_HYPBU|nr:RNA 3'-terminal phosphate cyclase [Hyperthermus butylicus]A2BN21.1 RecName: Full=RNA 3'-terminal phosphate cyclase; Short=RNA cyclase; Short=RNA-3'-phosphate cyclase [Hyperthermus butylicus DSM 5456]ABM81382.1 RNA 3'-terminal phosphate cyclase [Hyperthermus butylicus DSM 5456]